MNTLEKTLDILKENQKEFKENQKEFKENQKEFTDKLNKLIADIAELRGEKKGEQFRWGKTQWVITLLIGGGSLFKLIDYQTNAHAFVWLWKALTTF